MPATEKFEYCSSCTPGNFQQNTICVAEGPNQMLRMYYAPYIPPEWVRDRDEGGLSIPEYQYNIAGMEEEFTTQTNTENANKILVGPDRIPLPDYVAANECNQSLYGWNDSGLCVPDALDGTIDDSGTEALNAA